MPGIRKAAALGWHVVTVDYSPENVGHRYGHESVNCSTVDKDGVLKAARALNVDGICTFSSDVAIPTVAFVCEQLELPGASPVAAEIMATKNRFRAFQLAQGLPAPGFVSGSDLAAMIEGIQELDPPIVFKPVDTSGSRGVTRLDELEPDAVERAFLTAQGFSRSKTVCVEEFVPGIEVGGDAILVDGEIAFIAMTHKHLAGFVVTGHSLPTNIPGEDQGRIVTQLKATCAALGYVSGPLNFDAIVSPGDVTILEMSARNGGNGIPAVIERATGVDVETAALQLALGQVPVFPRSPGTNRGAGSLVFGSPVGGRLVNIRSPAALRRDTPEVFGVHYVKQVGQSVDAFTHNGNLIGFVLFDCEDSARYVRLTRKIMDSLDVKVQPE